jgi:hypothetical protein
VSLAVTGISGEDDEGGFLSNQRDEPVDRDCGEGRRSLHFDVLLIKLPMTSSEGKVGMQPSDRRIEFQSHGMGGAGKEVQAKKMDFGAAGNTTFLAYPSISIKGIHSRPIRLYHPRPRLTISLDPILSLWAALTRSRASRAHSRTRITFQPASTSLPGNSRAARFRRFSVRLEWSIPSLERHFAVHALGDARIDIHDSRDRGTPDPAFESEPRDRENPV